MIHIGTAGIPMTCKHLSTDRALKCIHALGLDALEVQFSRGINMSREYAQKISEENRKYGIKLSVHAPYAINLASADEKIIKRGINYLLLAMSRAALLNAEIVVLHAGYYSGRDGNDAYRLIKKSLEEISSRKENSVKIGVESMGKQKSFGTLDEIISLSNEIKDVVPVLDFGHLHARTNGSLKTEEDFENILKRVKKETRIKHLHIHMTSLHYQNGNERYHLTFDQKIDPDYCLLAEVLKKRNYNATIISESPDLERDALRFRNWLKAKN